MVSNKKSHLSGPNVGHHQTLQTNEVERVERYRATEVSVLLKGVKCLETNKTWKNVGFLKRMFLFQIWRCKGIMKM